jgi:UDPglucose 6-dehydrogenase
MNITIIGTGYVGLVTGVCFSDFGHVVTCVDKSSDKIAVLKQGQVPIYEAGLQDLLTKNLAANRISFTTDLRAGLKNAEAIFIAIGTPSRRGDGHADISLILDAAKEIALAMTDYVVVVIKSTVPVGTNLMVKEIIRQTNPEARFDVVSNPEFLREGEAVRDFMHPDRVVIGLETERARNVLAEIYSPIHLSGFPMVYTDLASAEMIKYASNAFLATKITFINEVAGLCEKVGANISQVALGLGLDGRIGNKFLHAGPGYGGSCFPKDTQALVRMGRENDFPMRIVETVIEVNDAVKRRMVKKIVQLSEGTIAKKIVAVLGVTFKPETDDMRDAPSLTIVPALLELGATVRVVDPKGKREGETLLPGVDWYDDAYAAAQDADVIVVLTEWNEFRALDLEKLAGKMSTARLADLRNIYNRQQATKAGFVAYDGVGQ